MHNKDINDITKVCIIQIVNGFSEGYCVMETRYETIRYPQGHWIKYLPPPQKKNIDPPDKNLIDHTPFLTFHHFFFDNR